MAWISNRHLAAVILGLVSAGAGAQPLFFDTNDTGPAPADVLAIRPWKTICLDPDYGGQWVVAADFVSCENHNVGDVHYTSTAVAHRLDGSVLWRWGDPDIGRKEWHHDVACQIHHWDGDGRPEVVLATKRAIVELDGRTGTEQRRIPIAEDATDCIVFADLAGRGRPTDVLVKNRYHDIYAYDRLGELLWQVRDPGDARTAHQPRPIDLDGDGTDEIAAGYPCSTPMVHCDGGSVRLRSTRTAAISTGSACFGGPTDWKTFAWSLPSAAPTASP